MTDFKKIEWLELLETALNSEGRLSEKFNRFYEYSFNNQLLMYLQGLNEPVATYKAWQNLGRQVKRGSTAKVILRPIIYEDKETEEAEIKGFKLIKCIFGLSETEGEELPPPTPRKWDLDKALANLAIKLGKFNELNGNIGGRASGDKIVVNPLFNGLEVYIHEMAHVLLHTDKKSNLDKSLKEYQAEATAFIVCKELLDGYEGKEQIGYIQAWLAGTKPSDDVVKEVLSTADKIIKAGRKE